ncbi:aminopeptidase-like protein 1 [Sarcoptes scabiei]|uniref:Aminopeptidase n=1 Tax=Sarcoptes scabiei TaxID=52283 RepID=A0A131ZUJ1_SARSC|nr:aminopeptidase-like protein 1 [Sarcoptes scabiei]
MVHDPEFRAYFNTEKISETNKIIGGQVKVVSQFERTVPMSTYLVAFIVCDFASIEIQKSNSMIAIENFAQQSIDRIESIESDATISNKNVRIRALIPFGQERNAEFALNAAKIILNYFENFFKIPYPLKKLDLVAVPDFGAGAMENWGLITFRMTTLLYNKEESSSEVKEQVAVVVAHEIAHQWFGNLVTMDWWNDLWLNEGFASFVENLGVDHFLPEWRMLDQFVISTSQQALALDSLLTSHPINTSVANPADIEETFDLISYKKGSCLIRMIVGFLGLDNLQQGLANYLNKYKYKTAKTSQLWESFSEVSDSLSINVSAIMDTWIFQKGYPLVTVRWSEDSQSLIVKQQPFISSLDPDEFERLKYLFDNTEESKQLKQKWIVPITLISNDAINRNVYWLETEQINIPLRKISNNWLKLNVNQSGFYRVNYEKVIWRELIRFLMTTKPDQHRLSPSDRAGLIDDALTLMRIGYLDVSVAMDLTKYLESNEQDYVPWETLLSQIGIIDSIMPQNLIFHRYVLRLIQKMITKLGWYEESGENLFDKKLRSLILKAAVFYGDKSSIQKAQNYFNEWIDENRSVPTNIRDIVYSAGIEHGTDREWNFSWRKYLNTTIVSEKRLLLGVLGSTRNIHLLSIYLQSSLNRSLVRPQDFYYVIQNVARNPYGRDLAWKFVRSNWHTIYEMLGLGSFALDTIVSETTWHFSTEFELNEVRKFFDSVQIGSGKQALRQSLEKIRANIFWKRNIQPQLIDWLERESINPTKNTIIIPHSVIHSTKHLNRSRW